MILIPNVTRCPACGRFVYAIDDRFATHPWPGVEAIPGFEAGLFHHACFRGLPWRDAFLALDAKEKNRTLDAESPSLTVLARTPAFAVVLRSVIEEYQLYFLPLGRRLDIRGLAAWGEFVAALTNADGPRPTLPDSRGGFRIARTNGSWELATRQIAPIDVEFAPADFARLRESLTGRGTDPTRIPVDLALACRQLGIQPSGTDAPLERLTGTFAWSETGRDATSVTLSIKVAWWFTVALSGNELADLRSFLHGLHSR